MSFQSSGYELVESFLSEPELEWFNFQLGAVQFPRRVGGIRNAQKKFQCVNTFISSTDLLNKVSLYFKGTPKFVRAILFNKTKSNNWLVAWHQDKTVAVSKKFAAMGWGPWSEKDGVLHVQPPIDVLNSMVTFRIHLDPTSEENGCLSVVPRSHELGILTQQEISDQSTEWPSVLCPAPAGSALVMRPHLLHCSGKGSAPSQRRVLHLEYSDHTLPTGVSWADGV